MAVSASGYLRIGATDVGAWMEFGTGVLGLMDARRDDEGGARFLRMDDQLGALPAETLALGQIVQTILLWSDRAFQDRSPLAALPNGGQVILRPEIAALIRAAYDPVLPAMSRDASHALRLSARLAAS